MIGLYASGEGVSQAWSVYPNRRFLDERLDELRAILSRVKGLGEDAKVGQPTDANGSATAPSIANLSHSEAKQAATDLIGEFSALRRMETDFRSRENRHKPAREGAPEGLNALLQKADDLLLVHFTREARRVAKAVTNEATSREVIQAIDDTLAPLQNLERGATP